MSNDVQKPLTNEQIWGGDIVSEPRPIDACPATNKYCKYWDEGVFNCLAASQCLDQNRDQSFAAVEDDSDV